MKDDSAGAFALVPTSPTTKGGARAAAQFKRALQRTEEPPLLATRRGARLVSRIQVVALTLSGLSALGLLSAGPGVLSAHEAAFVVLGLVFAPAVLALLALPDLVDYRPGMKRWHALRQHEGCKDALELCKESTWADAVRQTALEAGRELCVADAMEMCNASDAQKAFNEAESAALKRQEEAEQEAAACLELHAS